MPAIFVTEDIAVWHMTEDFETLRTYLTETELNRASAFGSESRRQEYCCTRAALATLSHEKLEISHTPSGKPFIKDRPELNISISHTRGFAAVYLGHEDKGIDIEYLSSRAERIMSRFLSQNEIANTDKEHFHTSLTLQWSAKEAIYKTAGHDVYDFREKILLSPFKVKDKGIIKATALTSHGSLSYIVHYIVTDDFVLTLAQSPAQSIPFQKKQPSNSSLPNCGSPANMP